jgi:hypothetical protein
MRASEAVRAARRPGVVARRAVARARGVDEEREQGGRVVGRRLERGVVGRPRLVGARQPVLEHPPALDEQVGALIGRERRAREDLCVGVGELVPEPALDEQPSQRPQRRGEGRLGGECLARRPQRLISVTQSLLFEARDLEPECRSPPSVRLDGQLRLVEGDVGAGILGRGLVEVRGIHG